MIWLCTLESLFQLNYLLDLSFIVIWSLIEMENEKFLQIFGIEDLFNCDLINLVFREGRR